ncbi:hypothetical protein PENTCL1PPCAC_11745, partial [Pristionchus entomophagus]
HPSITESEGSLLIDDLLSDAVHHSSLIWTSLTDCKVVAFHRNTKITGKLAKSEVMWDGRSTNGEKVLRVCLTRILLHSFSIHALFLSEIEISGVVVGLFVV